MARLLMVATDVVGERIAGPGIRCLELGRQLARAGHEVTVAAAGRSDLVSPPLTIISSPSPLELDAVARTQDAVFLQGFALRNYPSLRSLPAPLIVDLYDPFPLTLLEQFEQRPSREREAGSRNRNESFVDLLRCGDFFLCASDRQRDLWTGALLSAGRVNPRTWSEDNSLGRLIAVLPFGLPDSLPRATGGGLREEIPAINDGDIILLWGGGLYNWFDPLTLIEAVAQAAPRVGNLRLVFMSTGHPNPEVPAHMWMPARARALSDSLGVTGVHVFFHSEWVPYEERAAWLLAATCGVSTHFDRAETRYSFRTRILDYLWAGLPIIASDGDGFADLIKENRLGWIVPPGDVTALAGAIEEMASDPGARKAMSLRVAALAQEFTWPRVAKPLLAFCDDPRLAADAPRAKYIAKGRPSGTQLQLQTARRLAGAGVHSVRIQGIKPTAQAIVRRWKRSRRARR
jgi:glycosyltransferase involved in cell wall biosynthesis